MKTGKPKYVPPGEFADAGYVVYASTTVITSPSDSIWMVPGTHPEDPSTR